MTEFAIRNASLFTGKNVLELGSGTGFLGLAIARLLQPRAVYLTDGNHDVLNILRSNVEINALLNASVLELDWFQCEEAALPASVDVVIASDVVFDPAFMAPLARTINWLITKFPGVNVLLALSVRNMETLAQFSDHVSERGLEMSVVEEVCVPTGRLQACYTMIAPVRILQLTRQL